MKYFRLILPALAFLFAFGTSYATLNVKPLALTVVSVSHPGPPCEVIGFCVLGGTSICVDDDGIVVKQYLSATNCPHSVIGWWQ